VVELGLGKDNSNVTIPLCSKYRPPVNQHYRALHLFPVTRRHDGTMVLKRPDPSRPSNQVLIVLERNYRGGNIPLKSQMLDGGHAYMVSQSREWLMLVVSPGTTFKLSAVVPNLSQDDSEFALSLTKQGELGSESWASYAKAHPPKKSEVPQPKSPTPVASVQVHPQVGVPQPKPATAVLKKPLVATTVKVSVKAPSPKAPLLPLLNRSVRDFDELESLLFPNCKVSEQNNQQMAVA
jgi:hypothetical protein